MSSSFNVTSQMLHCSQLEWCSQIVNTVSPSIKSGILSMLQDAIALCKQHTEPSKYLVIFQKILAQIPKWSAVTIGNECERIAKLSGCSYLGEMVACVHLAQIKLLAAARTGRDVAPISIDMPSKSEFVHQCYIRVARLTYANIRLFEQEVSGIQIQENKRAFELLVREGIIDAIRASIPLDMLLNALLNEQDDIEVDVEIKDEIISEIPLDSNSNSNCDFNATANLPLNPNQNSNQFNHNSNPPSNLNFSSIAPNNINELHPPTSVPPNQGIELSFNDPNPEIQQDRMQRLPATLPKINLDLSTF